MWYFYEALNNKPLISHVLPESVALLRPVMSRLQSSSSPVLQEEGQPWQSCWSERENTDNLYQVFGAMVKPPQKLYILIGFSLSEQENRFPTWFFLVIHDY